ncbi:MAG TPA: 50S ribosomal protein L6 [Steroidobacteraceae bacterium]
MSRVANRIIDLPSGVTVSVVPGAVTVKGARGVLNLILGEGVSVMQQDKTLSVKYEGDDAVRMRAGATRAHLANMVLGVTKGYDRKLELVGVGFRAQVAGKALNLTLGFSHPVSYAIPEGITIETPSQTEILIKGNDRQKVGQTAAEIRGIRPPEPYKGKGVRYSDEKIILKEGKKK